MITAAEHRTIYFRQEAIRRSLERNLRGRMAAELRTVAREAAASKNPLSAVNKHMLRLESILFEFYIKALKRSARHFDDSAIKAGFEIEVKKLNPDPLARLQREWATKNAAKKVLEISDTTRNKIAAAIAFANEDPSGDRDVADEILSRVGSIAGSRALTIARTESHAAAQAGGYMAAESLGVVTTKEWVAAEDERTRETHNEADGQIVAIDDEFTVGDSELTFPGDPDGTAEEVINCHIGSELVCADNLRAVMRNLYVGDIVTIRTASGNESTATPNHPVLTDTGWKAIGDLKEGDHVLSHVVDANLVSVSDPNIERRYTAISKVYDAIHQSCEPVRIPAMVVNFHGDPTASDVDIVRVNDGLPGERNANRRDLFGDLGFTSDSFPAAASSVSGAVFSYRSADGGMPDGISGLEAEDVGLAAGASLKTALSNDATDKMARQSGGLEYGQHGQTGVVVLDDPIAPCETFSSTSANRAISRITTTDQVDMFPNGHNRSLRSVRDLVVSGAGTIFLDPVVDVRRRNFIGHVFSLSCYAGMYTAAHNGGSGIIYKNCRCVLAYHAGDKP